MSVISGSKTGPQSAVKSAAVRRACQRVEELLSKSPAYRKVDDAPLRHQAGIDAGDGRPSTPGARPTPSCAWSPSWSRACTMEVQLALELLEINAVLRFGAFAFVPAGDVILFCHTMADRELTDEEEFMEHHPGLRHRRRRLRRPDLRPLRGPDHAGAAGGERRGAPARAARPAALDEVLSTRRSTSPR